MPSVAKVFLFLLCAVVGRRRAYFRPDESPSSAPRKPWRSQKHDRTEAIVRWDSHLHQAPHTGRAKCEDESYIRANTCTMLLLALNPALAMNPSHAILQDRFASARFKRFPSRSGAIPVMIAALRDYSATANVLFSNMRVPAALIAGATVPLGFAAAPTPDAKDTPRKRFLKVVHLLLAMATIVSELLTVTWSTVSLNKLAELPVAPSNGVDELLRRDFEVQWLGCNVHFFLGLCTYVAMIGLRVLIDFGASLGRIGVLSSAAGLAMMFSILNDGIAQGDGEHLRFGMNFASIMCRYLKLLFARAAGGGHVLLATSLVLALVAIGAAVQELRLCRTCNCDL